MNDLKILGNLENKTYTEDGKKVYTYLVTSEVLDRSNEIIDIDTIQWKNFDKNGVGRYEHNQDIDPICNWFNRKVINDKVYMDTILNKIPDSRTNQNISANVEELIESGDLKGCSIGFPQIYIRTELQLLDNNTVIKPNGKIIQIPADKAEIIRKTWYNQIILCQNIEVVEISLCAIPANQETLRVKSLNLSIKEKTMDYKSIDLKDTNFKKFIEDNRDTIESLLDIKKGAAISKDTMKKVDDCMKACKAIDDHVATHSGNMKACKSEIMKSLKAIKPKPTADEPDGDEEKDEDMQGNSIDYNLITKSFEKALKPLLNKIEELNLNNIANEDDIKKLMEGK